MGAWSVSIVGLSGFLLRFDPAFVFGWIVIVESSRSASDCTSDVVDKEFS